MLLPNAPNARHGTSRNLCSTKKSFSYSGPCRHGVHEDRSRKLHSQLQQDLGGCGLYHMQSTNNTKYAALEIARRYFQAGVPKLITRACSIPTNGNNCCEK